MKAIMRHAIYGWMVVLIFLTGCTTAVNQQSAAASATSVITATAVGELPTVGLTASATATPTPTKTATPTLTPTHTATQTATPVPTVALLSSCPEVVSGTRPLLQQGSLLFGTGVLINH